MHILPGSAGSIQGNALQNSHLSPVRSIPSKGWRAGIKIELNHLNGRTIMGKTRHYGPLRVQRPFWPEGKDLTHLYILHPPGGLVAGDELTQHFIVNNSAKGLVTTPAAGKVYFNGNGQLQRQITNIIINDYSCMEWLPQETIIFNGAIAELETTIEMNGNARFCGWDIVCLGRTASGEQFTQGRLTQTLHLIHDNKPLYRERLSFDASSNMRDSLLGLHGRTVFGTFLMTLKEMPDLTDLHDLLVNSGWHEVTAITWRAGVLIVRYLGHSSEQAREVFTRVWETLREAFNRRKGCRPRIWNT